MVRGERPLGASEFAQRTVEYDLPAVLSGARADVQDPIGGLHHLGIVLDHDQGVAGVAQTLHDADDPADIARMKSDGRLVEYE